MKEWYTRQILLHLVVVCKVFLYIKKLLCDMYNMGTKQKT